MEVVNKITGEVIDIPNKSIIKKEFNTLITDQLLEQLEQVEYLQDQIDLWKFQHKEAIKELFKKNDIKSFKNEYIEITYVAPTKRKVVDTDLLKQAGIYDQFTKEADVKESLRIKLVKD